MNGLISKPSLHLLFIDVIDSQSGTSIAIRTRPRKYARLHALLKFFACLGTQVEQNDDCKRSYTAVYVNVYDGKRHTYDCIRPVNHPFGRYRTTAVYGRAVNDRILQQYTAKYVPHYGRYSSHTAVKPNVSGRFSPSCIVTNVP